MKFIFRLFVSTLIILTASSLMTIIARTHGFRPVVANQTTVAKVDQWLAQSGLSSKKTGDGTWVIYYAGKTGSKMPMLLAAGSDYIVVGEIVAVKKNMRVTNDLMFKLLKLNHNVDYVKIGFDDDDDLFVRIEVKTKLLDAQQFKANVDTVAAASDRVYGEIKSFLITP